MLAIGAHAYSNLLLTIKPWCRERKVVERDSKKQEESEKTQQVEPPPTSIASKRDMNRKSGGRMDIVSSLYTFNRTIQLKGYD